MSRMVAYPGHPVVTSHSMSKDTVGPNDQARYRAWMEDKCRVTPGHYVEVHTDHGHVVEGRVDSVVWCYLNYIEALVIEAQAFPVGSTYTRVIKWSHIVEIRPRSSNGDESEQVG